MSDFGSSAVDVAQLLGGATALVVLGAGARERYRRTLGRRRDRYERLGRLGTGAQLSFFVAVLGEPPAMLRTITKDDYRVFVSADDPRFDASLVDPALGIHQVDETRLFTESFFIDRDYYVQALSDADGTVLAFSVTTRSRRFRPVFEAPRRMTGGERRKWRELTGTRYSPLLRVQLGRTRFADLDPRHPDEFAGPHLKMQTGARHFRYSEYRYFGNPGYYQTFVLTASSTTGPFPVGVPPPMVVEEIGGEEWPDPSREGIEPAWEVMPRTHEFRRSTAVTTYTVIGSALEAENFPTTFGPRGDEVRTLP